MDALTYNMSIALPGGQPISVCANLYYQSIPPFYLKKLFQFIDKPAARNLFYIVQEMNVSSTEINDWKMLLAKDCKSIQP